MKRNWICSTMVVAMFALLAGGCGNSQRTLEFRGICVDDAQGEHGLYNPGRGFRLETAVDVLHEKIALPKNWMNCPLNICPIVCHWHRVTFILPI